MQTITVSSATTAQPRAARRYGLILFFVAAYAWTWLFQLLSVLIARQTISLPLPRELVETIGFLGPALAALGVTASSRVVGRTHYTLLTLGTLAFIWFLNYWNLLGFRW